MKKAWQSLAVVMALGLVGCGVLQPTSNVEHGDNPPLSTPTPAQPPAAFDTLGIVAYAASMQGKPYRSGGNTPAQGFDCSGLVQHVFAHFSLALPRSAGAIAESLPSVSLFEIQAADLIFFDTGNGDYSHVGIYLGDGRFVHAPSPQTGHVIISQLSNTYWRTRITGARRPQAVEATRLSQN